MLSIQRALTASLFGMDECRPLRVRIASVPSRLAEGVPKSLIDLNFPKIRDLWNYIRGPPFDTSVSIVNDSESIRSLKTEATQMIPARYAVPSELYLILKQEHEFETDGGPVSRRCDGNQCCTMPERQSLIRSASTRREGNDIAVFGARTQNGPRSGRPGAGKSTRESGNACVLQEGPGYDSRNGRGSGTEGIYLIYYDISAGHHLFGGRPIRIYLI